LAIEGQVGKGGEEGQNGLLQSELPVQGAVLNSQVRASEAEPVLQAAGQKLISAALWLSEGGQVLLSYEFGLKPPYSGKS